MRRYVGRKSGKGIFVYTPSTKERDENVGAMDILKRYSTVSPLPYVILCHFITSTVSLVYMADVV